MQINKSTLSNIEIKRFSDYAEEWWSPKGNFRALHDIMPLREKYILEQLSINCEDKLPLKGISVLDVGCGGGLISEFLTKMGAIVVGIDAGEKAINIAREHAQKSNLDIDYRNCTIEELCETDEKFDAIIAFEIVEHVNNLSFFIESMSKMLKPGGKILISTINRTYRSFILGIVGAEYIMKMVPLGTHNWDKFVKPSQIVDIWAKDNLSPIDITGIIYKPLSGKFEFSDNNVSVNYFITGKKKL